MLAYAFSESLLLVLLSRALAGLAANALAIADLYEEQQRLRTQAEAAQRRQTFLAEASAALSSSLDFEVTLEQVAQLAVPEMADWCAVRLPDEQGNIRQLAVAHALPEKRKWAEEVYLRYPVQPDQPYGIARVLRTGEGEFYPQVPQESLLALAQNEEHRQILQEMDFRSAIVVPMNARGATLGAILLVRTGQGNSEENGRQRVGEYRQEDYTLALELARRAALAADNARLYQEAQKQLVERTRSAEGLRRIASFAHCILWYADVWDVEEPMMAWRIQVADEEAAQRFFPLDVPPDRTYAQILVEARLPEDRAKMDVFGEGEAKAGRNYQQEYRCRNRYGEVRWLAEDVHLEPVGQGHWRAVGVTTDITERKQAEEAAREGEARQQVFVREILFSVTEGKLRLCESEADLPPKLSPACEHVPLTDASSLSVLRRHIRQEAKAAGFADERWQDLLTASGEAAMNAVVHAGGGDAQVCTGKNGCSLQVWVQDKGSGIAVNTLHRATLKRGFTTAGTLGHGFWMMLSTVDRIWLLTGAQGTTVVLEQDQSPPPPHWFREGEDEGDLAKPG